jgi:integrase
MRPLKYSINVTLDGCVDHRAGSTDEELHRFWAEKLAQADALLFGRVTYEMMQAAWRWPANGLRPEWMAEWMEPFARTIDAAKKYVVSSTLSQVDWNAELLRGDLAKAVEQLKRESGKKQPRGPRSPVTARNYVVTVLAALNWAEYMGWIPAVPKVRKLKISKLRQMKGRPIAGEEFDRMLANVKSEVGAEAESSWKYILRGAWESALRLDELMHLHWSDEQSIVPLWKRGALPVLAIPAAMQKNDTEESIPLLPSFEALLLETPEAERFGWVFNPMSLQTKLGRGAKQQRPDAEWVGKIISRIGEAAGVIVRPATTKGQVKYASAHDLRRSCAERLISAGVPEREVSRILRHASVETTRRHYAPGNVQESAGIIRSKLALSLAT